MTISDEPQSFRLNALLAEAGLAPLSAAQAAQFENYLSLFVRWNAHINLTSVRTEDGILSRHFVESIACARALPGGIATLLDLGSGGGFPGIPIAICHPEIAVTLAESQGKKAAFLQEAVRVLGLNSRVCAARAETLNESFDCVTLRAVDKMPEAVGVATTLVAPGGWLALMTSTKELDALRTAAGKAFAWSETHPHLGGEDRLLALGQKAVS
jgi:16S rRNA (guanine527-N7)-methyltransferase